MTSKYFVERGVKQVNANFCGECMFFNRAFESDNGYKTGPCGNEHSDHYCHVLNSWHPACEKFMMVMDVA